MFNFVSERKATKDTSFRECMNYLEDCFVDNDRDDQNICIIERDSVDPDTFAALISEATIEANIAHHQHDYEQTFCSSYPLKPKRQEVEFNCHFTGQKIKRKFKIRNDQNLKEHLSNPRS